MDINEERVSVSYLLSTIKKVKTIKGAPRDAEIFTNQLLAKGWSILDVISFDGEASGPSLVFTLGHTDPKADSTIERQK
jgi:hypothetical protein